MPRCQCNRGGDGGFLEAGPGIQITGDPTNRRTISLRKDDALCAIVQTCVAGMLCRALTVEAGCLAVQISTDAGNVVSVDPDDGGLTATCPPLPDACGMTTRTLPPATFCSGTWGMGWMTGPGVIDSYEKAIALGLPFSLARLQRLADGSFVVAQLTLDDSAYEPRSDLGFRTLTPPQTRSILLDPDAAWGWCEPHVGLDPLAQLLAVTRGRQVVSLELTAEAPLEGGTETIPMDAVDDLLRVIDQHCARRHVIVHYTGGRPASELDRLQRVAAEGIETGINIGSQTQADRYPPAALVAAGVRWVYVQRSLPDAVFTGYKDAGLQVCMVRALSHTDHDRAVTLGLRGILADDPAYVCKLNCPVHNSDRVWCSSSIPSGQIAARQFIADNYGGQMGKPAGDGAFCGWSPPLENAGRRYSVQLLGWTYDLPDPSNFTIRWSQAWTEEDGGLTPTSTFGLLICAPTDELPISADQLEGPTTMATSISSGYALRHRTGDPASPASTVMELTKYTKGAAPGPTVTATGTRDILAEGLYVPFRAIVTPDAIRYQRLTIGGTVQYEVILGTGGTADPEPRHRGHYIWMYKLQGSGSGTSRRMQTHYRGVNIT